MTRPAISLAVLAGAALVASTVAAAPAPATYAGRQFAPMARITMAQARATALRARPGMITDQELEKEAGGSGLRYSFDVKRNGKTFEVGVDAKTGAVLENGAEGAHPD
ncbi:MAG TPA: PepSY domain-containing protein [Caulobacteraceae bacterium]